jgi:hypothetical protein
VRGVSVQVAVPLHDRAMHVVLSQLTAAPVQAPALQESECVHASLSSQRAPVRHCQIPPSFVQ